jgi:ribosome-associated protein
MARGDAAAAVRVTSACAIPLSELEWRFSGPGGPGGQHANTSNTRVEVRFDVSRSPSLGPRQRARLLDRLGPVVRVVAADTRAQARNRELALGRLRVRLADALRIERSRRPTRAPAAAAGARLRAKRRRGEIKRSRRRPEADE